MWRHLSHSIRFGLGTLVVLTFVLQPFSMVGEAKQAYAGGGITGGALEITQLRNVAANTMNTLLTGSLEAKEYGLDTVAFFIAKLALQSITQSLINWINSGFQGRPAFVSDLKNHLLETADRAIGEFIENSELGFLCSPFELDVRIALTRTYAEKMSDRDQYEASCSLSEVTDNVQGFLGGDFIGGGGWPSWFEMTQNPMENTAMGQAMNLQFALDAKIAEAEVNATRELSFGDGFLSFKQCDDEGNNCTINTPGKVISEALTFQLSTGAQTLIEADELNELFSALFYQIANRVIQGVGGLLGSTQGSLFDDMNEEAGNIPNNFVGSDFVPVAPNGDTVTGEGIDINQILQDILDGLNGGGGGDPDPDDPSVDPVDPLTGEPLDPTIPGTEDGSIDPVTEDLDDVVDDLPSADPVDDGGGDPLDPV